MPGITREAVGIHWFRRDLRIRDNTALDAALSTCGKVVCVYILSSWKSGHRWTGPMRQQFLCGCLESLRANLRALGGDLIIREGEPVEVLSVLSAEVGATRITFNRDPDPHGRAVERRLVDALPRLSIEGHKDACIHERSEVLTASNEPFRVFSPYARAWHKCEKPAIHPRPRTIHSIEGVSSLPLPTVAHWNLTPHGHIPEAGEKAARNRLKSFLENGIANYSRLRNIPAGTTTSRLSQDLRFGLLSPREILELCQKKSSELDAAGRKGVDTFVSELVWREFYMAILWHFPEVLDQEFNPKYRDMRWPGNPENLTRWVNGETGFPIVDAAMRQLNQTGFMHNRTRMITAMFLTKDLHLDWRLGESVFMQRLVDGEIASNNGGWQWSAGTGADAAPYFRIQNPWTQTSRYDPDGEYIKEWIPELRDVEPRLFHAPPADNRPLVPAYPTPIVDHSEARQITLDLFQTHNTVRDV
jgi:deoxyribodipyrimidine photo-lyase